MYIVITTLVTFSPDEQKELVAANQNRIYLAINPKGALSPRGAAACTIGGDGEVLSDAIFNLTDPMIFEGNAAQAAFQARDRTGKGCQVELLEVLLDAGP